ncbi:hypothetical protein PILCRDRAFT_12005, partial [Piloderma croceum F 1598]
MRASSGMHKMKYNAIMFENPTPKIYQRLPPPVEDLDEDTAPRLKAEDVVYNNLEAYPENGPPVVITYRSAEGNKVPEATSAFDNEDEDGVEDGPCPFVVNGVMGEQLESMTLEAMIAKAAKHLREDDGGVLAVGHDDRPQSTYHNPQLYPMMFPCLFPYGLGGIGSVNGDALDISDIMHKQKLL